MALRRSGVRSPSAPPPAAGIDPIAATFPTWRIKKLGYLLLGFLAIGVGTIGVFVPLLPTVPLYILAAFCFARSNPALERRIVEHPALSTHIAAWRQRGAISRKGKAAAVLAFTASAVAGLLLLRFPLMLLPAAVALVGGGWILSRPTA